MRLLTPLPLIAVLALSCGAGPKPQAAAKPAAQKHYPLTGKVVSVDAKQQSAAIDAAAIPNFMEAMTMDYPIESKTDFATLRAGDKITATVDVYDDGSYTLSHIKPEPAAPKK